MAVPVPDESDRRTRILWALRRFAEAVEHLQDDWAATTALHRSDLAALTHLAGSDEPLTMRGLADRLTLSPGATTSLVDRLEARGHVARGVDPRDRRRVTVALSAEAAGLGASFFGDLAQRVSTAMAGYDDAELELIERFLADVTPAVAPDLAPREPPEDA